MPKDLNELLKNFNFEIIDKKLITAAMTHKSYAAEHNLDYDNQRLEFLGDAVLQIIITEYLYVKYPDEQEGRLTKMRSALARREAFATLAKEMKLDDYIRMGKGEIQSGGMTRDSTLCDAFEAMAGAIYLDLGIAPVAEILIPILQKKFPDPLGLLGDLNPKGMLQEYTQKHYDSEKPEYIIVNKIGPDHDCEYSITVSIKGEIVGKGKGKSRKSAEMDAATDAIEKLQKI